MVKIRKKYKDLAPHEVRVLSDEFYREKMVQERLWDAIYWDMLRRVIKKLGGVEKIDEIIKKIEDSGLTREQASNMSNKEFEKYLKKNNILV